jgi:hypothetical protein
MEMTLPRVLMKTFQTLLVLLPLSLGGCADFGGGFPGDAIMRSVLSSPDSALDERTVAAGLKEALRIGTDRTVSSTARVDGFLANALIRIVLPDQLAPMGGMLRTVGLGSQVDALEVSMNRAAELAAGEAREIFVDAISRMTLTDAFNILNGGDSAATTYFRDRTEDTLRNRFRPVINQKMNEVGLYRLYGQLVAAYTAIPLATEPPINLSDYVTEKSLDGLFAILAQEETRIRRDPAARTTELLRKVFSG